jgi:hypothetical protein
MRFCRYASRTRRATDGFTYVSVKPRDLRQDLSWRRPDLLRPAQGGMGTPSGSGTPFGTECWSRFFAVGHATRLRHGLRSRAGSRNVTVRPRASDLANAKASAPVNASDRRRRPSRSSK